LTGYEDAYDRLADTQNRPVRQFDRALKRLDIARALSANAINVPGLPFPEYRQQLVNAEDAAGDVYDALVKNRLRSPINVDVEVLEVRAANQYLLAVAKALESARGDVTTAIWSNIDPAARRQARADEDQAAEDLTVVQVARRRAVLEKDQLVDTKRLEMLAIDAAARPADYLRARQALELAIFDANEARRLAGLPSLP